MPRDATGTSGSTAEDAGSTPRSAKRVVSVGRSWLECRVIVWNEIEQREAKEDEVGEVLLAGENCCAGYFGQPLLSERTFGVELAGLPDARFLRTGDLGFFSAGELYITGRSKDLIVIRGRNVYPEDIEAVAQACQSSLVRQGGAAVEVDLHGQSLVVLVQETMPKASSADPRIVREAISAAVSRELGIKLHDIVLLRRGKLPKTTSGKIARSKVREMLMQGELPMEQPVPIPSSDTRRAQRANDMSDWWRGVAGRIDGRLMDERRCISPHLLLEFGNRGFLGMLAPECVGGAALGVREMLELVRHVASVDLTLSAFLGVHNGLVIGPVQTFGSPEQKSRYLADLARGRMLGCFALTEPGAGSNPRAICARAERRGRKWILSGHKTWIGTAAWSGLAVFFAQAYESDGTYLGMTSFLLPTDTAGVRQGPETLTLGMRGMVQNDLIVESAEVDESQILGDIGGGYEVAQSTMAFGRLGVAVMALGCMQRAVVVLTNYARRRQISTGSLISNPVLSRRLMRMHASIASLSELARRCAARIDAGEEVPLEVLSAIKAVASEECWGVVDATLQALGGRGYDESNRVAQMLRDCRLLRIFEGPTEALLDYVGHAVASEFDSVSAFALQHLSREGTLVGELRQETAALLRECVDHGLSVRAAHPTIGEAAGVMLLHGGLLAAQDVEPGLREMGSHWMQQRLRDLFAAWRADARDWSASDPDSLLLRLATMVGDDLCDWAPMAMNVRHDPARELVDVGPGPAESRSAVRALDASSAKASAPASEHRTLSWLQQWITRRNPRSEPGAETSFAEIGLDSIDAVELMADFNDAFALDVNPGVLWEFSNLRKLSRYLASREGEARGIAADQALEVGLRESTIDLAARLERELSN